MSSYDYLSGLSGIDTNNINSTESVKKYYALTIAKQAMSKAYGDGMEFELVYQALLDSMAANSSSTSSSNISSDKLNVLTGVNLEDLPMNTYSAYANSYAVSGSSELTSSTGSASIDSLIEKYSSLYNVDANLVKAVIQTESNFNPNVTSSAGAKGLMQIMDCISTEYNVTNPYDPEQNIRAGVNLLSDLLKRYNGDVGMALMAYNAGPGTMQSRGVKSIDDIYKMPTETQNYYKKIMKILGA